MHIDPVAEARRLLEQFSPAERQRLAEDPASTVKEFFDVEVTLRPARTRASDCTVEGTYNPGPPPSIVAASDVAQERTSFTILHELGHHLIELDVSLNDLSIDEADRRDEEICDEIAARVLMPEDVREKLVPAGRFTARNVAQLYEATRASRQACCVTAAGRLRAPGCVILAHTDGVSTYVAHDPTTQWRIARGTPQGEDSLIAKAARGYTKHARGVTNVRFASGAVSGAMHGDAFAADDGWVYAVIVEDPHSPWERTPTRVITNPWPDAEVIECGRCGEVSQTRRAPCRRCGDRYCRRCGRCSCPLVPATRLCSGCFLQKASNQFADGSEVCVDCV